MTMSKHGNGVNMEVSNTNAFLFVTHKVDVEVLERYSKLECEVRNFGKSFFLLNQEEGEEVEFVLPENSTPYIFNTHSLDKLDYEPIEETIIPGSNHFATLQFYLDNPHYMHYWVIEYDVIYTGNWSDFFIHFSSIDVDFIASHMERFSSNPYWYWWNTLHLDNVRLDGHQLIRSFNPIYRISNKALLYLDQLLKGRRNWGHHEVLIPTALNYSKFRILDLGGNGEFVPMEFVDKFYLMRNGANEGSMRDKPPIREDELNQRNMLLHPCKTNDY